MTFELIEELTPHQQRLQGDVAYRDSFIAESIRHERPEIRKRFIFPRTMLEGGTRFTLHEPTNERTSPFLQWLSDLWSLRL